MEEPRAERTLPSLPVVIDRMVRTISCQEHVPLYIPRHRAASNRVPPPGVYRQERHTTYELVYIDEGTCHMVVENTIIDMKQGDILLIPPLHSHYIVPKTGAGCYALWLGIELRYIGLHVVYYDEDTRRIADCITISSDASVNTAVEQIHHEAIKEDVYSDIMVKGYLLSLTGYLGRPIKHLGSTEVGSVPNRRDTVIQSAITYMEGNYANPELTVAAMAHHVAMSVSYFSSRFKNVTGYSPYHYLLLIRMEKARRLICTTKEPMDTIGAAVGFLYPHHFSTTFRRIFGMTPSALRSQSQAGSIPIMSVIGNCKTNLCP